MAAAGVTRRERIPVRVMEDHDSIAAEVAGRIARLIRERAREGTKRRAGVGLIPKRGLHASDSRFPIRPNRGMGPSLEAPAAVNGQETKSERKARPEPASRNASPVRTGIGAQP